MLVAAVIRFPGESVGSKSEYSHRQNLVQDTVIIFAKCIIPIVSRYYQNISHFTLYLCLSHSIDIFVNIFNVSINTCVN